MKRFSKFYNTIGMFAKYVGTVGKVWTGNQRDFKSFQTGQQLFLKFNYKNQLHFTDTFRKSLQLFSNYSLRAFLRSEKKEKRDEKKSTINLTSFEKEILIFKSQIEQELSDHLETFGPACMTHNYKVNTSCSISFMLHTHTHTYI